MSVILKKYKGESATFGFMLPESYDLSNLENVRVFVGNQIYSHTVENERLFKVALKSEDTICLDGRLSVIFDIDDSVFGIKKVLVGEFQVDPTTDTFSDASANTGIDVTFALSISETSITIDSVLYDVIKGDSAFQVWQSQAGNEGKTYDDYIAYLREPMTLAIEDGNETAAQWAINEAERVANELIREENEEDRIAAEIIREQVKDATIIAKNEAIQAKDDANNAANLANELSSHPLTIQNDYWFRWNPETNIYENTGVKAKGDAFVYSDFTAEQLLALKGDSVEIVNDLTTGGAAKALSAEQGKVLQPKLTSGVNIKTVGGQSILGSGDIPVNTSGASVSVTNVLQSNKLDKVVGKNKFNADGNNQVGKYINSVGTIAEHWNFFVSEFIFVTPNTNYIASGIVFNAGYYAFYNVNQTLISTFNTNSFTTPSDCVYVRLSGWKSYIPTLQVELGNNVTNYGKYEPYTPMGDLNNNYQTDKFEIILPSKLYFAKNYELCIYTENSVYKNLNDSAKLYINKGVNFNDLVRFNFNTVATSTMDANVSKGLKKISNKTLNYEVVDAALNAGKAPKLLFIGDSFTNLGGYITELKLMLTNSGCTPKFIGTRGNEDFDAEGVSGNALLNLIYTKNPAKILNVTNITTINNTFPESAYLDQNGKTWYIGGRNITNGSGKIRVWRAGAVANDFIGFPTNGILTKISGIGDNVINYTDATDGYYNPFINYSTGLFDFDNYFEVWELEKPDVTIIQYTWNDLPFWSSAAEIVGVADRFKFVVDSIKATNPLMKIIIAIVPYSSPNGIYDYNGKKYSVLNCVKLINSYFEDINYNSFVTVAPAYATVDLINGYSTTQVTPCARYPELTERSYGDSVHPTFGMKQIADCLFPIVTKYI